MAKTDNKFINLEIRRLFAAIKNICDINQKDEASIISLLDSSLYSVALNESSNNKRVVSDLERKIKVLSRRK